MAATKILAAFAIFAIIIAYLVYQPLPDDIEEQWAVRGFLFLWESSIKLSIYGEKLGISTWPKTTRILIDYVTTLFLSTGIPDSMTITDAVFDGVSVRIYHPATATKDKPTGAVVYYHGGGWVWGSIDAYEPLTIALAEKTGVPVVSVGYRLAPEFIYPVPLDDCVAATIHLMENAKDYNIDPKKIVIGGDSAGGNLAAAVALRLNSMKYPILPAGQVLIYPPLQAFEFQIPSHLQNNIFITIHVLTTHVLIYLGLDAGLADAMVANNHTTAAMKAKYSEVFDVTLLPEKYQSQQYRRPLHEGTPEIVEQLQQKISDPFFAPLMASPELVRGFPSVYIITAGHDALRDHGFFYAHKLRQAGVEVKHADYPRAYHPFLMQFDGLLRTQLASEAFDGIVEYVKHITIAD